MPSNYSYSKKYSLPIKAKDLMVPDNSKRSSLNLFLTKIIPKKDKTFKVKKCH